MDVDACRASAPEKVRECMCVLLNICLRLLHLLLAVFYAFKAS
jgi:hypothetical protein